MGGRCCAQTSCVVACICCGCCPKGGGADCNRDMFTRQGARARERCAPRTLHVAQSQPVEARVAFGDRHVNYACEWVGGEYVPKENVRQSASGPAAVKKPGTVVNPMRADAQEFI